MKRCPQVEFRPKTEPPTEPGWYWGKFSPLEDYRPTDTRKILPRLIVEEISSGRMDVIIGDKFKSIDQFIWFGRVHEVREAS